VFFILTQSKNQRIDESTNCCNTKYLYFVLQYQQSDYNINRRDNNYNRNWSLYILCFKRPCTGTCTCVQLPTTKQLRILLLHQLHQLYFCFICLANWQLIVIQSTCTLYCNTKILDQQHQNNSKICSFCTCVQLPTAKHLRILLLYPSSTIDYFNNNNESVL
jgi:hypothetical protein